MVYGGQLSPLQQKIYLLCIDISDYSQVKQFTVCTISIFAFFLLYGYMQELLFTLDGFQSLGWYLTLVQFSFYSVFGWCETRIRRNTERRIPLKTYFLLALLTLGTMGFSNTSVGYLNYPTQVLFKCCKLIPVLIGGILIQGKRYGPLDFTAAALMCFGLTLFILADSTMVPDFNTTGITLISMALFCDAAIGNVQEKSMKTYGATNAEVVLYSYSIGFTYLAVILLLTGELWNGVNFFAMYPTKTYGYALVFSATGYLGTQIVLTLVRTCGAFVAVTVTTFRKAVTIIISFLLFSKPFTFLYLYSGLIVAAGIYLSFYAKNHPISTTDIELYVLKWIQKIKNRFKKPSSYTNSNHYSSNV